MPPLLLHVPLRPVACRLAHCLPHTYPPHPTPPPPPQAAPGELLPDWPRLMHCFRTPQLTINLPGGVQYCAVPQTVREGAWGCAGVGACEARAHSGRRGGGSAGF